MPHQHIVLEVQRLDHTFRISSEINQTVAAGGAVGLAPTAVVDGEGVEVRGQGGGDMLPGSR